MMYLKIEIHASVNTASELKEQYPLIFTCDGMLIVLIGHPTLVTDKNTPRYSNLFLHMACYV